MASIKVDGDFYDHPKIVEIGPLGTALFVCGISYCAQYLTDGFIAAGQVKQLLNVDDPIAIADRLVEVGLWETANGGYRVRDCCGCAMTRDRSTQEQRKTRAYEAWRRAVLERDGFKCVQCGTGYCELHAHHISQWAKDRARRLDIDNGLTLCVECHRLAHRRADGCTVLD